MALELGPNVTQCGFQYAGARVQFRLCCIMHSVSYGTCPAYLTNIVERAGAGRTRSGLRSTSSTDYTLPRLRTKFAERAFSYAGPSAWNGLSEDLRAVADPAEFRKQLTTHCLLQLIMFTDICSRGL